VLDYVEAINDGNQNDKFTMRGPISIRDSDDVQEGC